MIIIHGFHIGICYLLRRICPPNGNLIIIDQKKSNKKVDAISYTILKYVTYYTDNEKLQEIHDHLRGLTINNKYKWKKRI